MQLNIPPTGKRVTKLTVKAKAALEEHGPAAKKRTADGDSENIHPKKAKKAPPHGTQMTGKAKAFEEKTIRTSSHKRTTVPGNGPTNTTGSADEDDPVDKDRPFAASPHPDLVPSRCVVVRAEEEENPLYEDEGDKTEAGSTVSQAADDQADETAEDQLSMCNNLEMNITLIEFNTERLMKDWNSPVYAFFHPTPQIVEVDGRHAHDFKCQAKRCKNKVRRYLDKGDARSTGNMRKHVRSCWGNEVLKAADQAKDADEVRQRIIGNFLRNGSITTSFERIGKGKVTYSHRQHTRAETRWEPSLIKVLRI